jgi:hypothetical protein
MTRVEREAVIAVGADALWALVGDFGKVAEWHPLVSACSIEPHGSTQPSRRLILEDGTEVHEQLVLRDAAARHLRYRMLTFPLPVSAQDNSIDVSPTAGGQARLRLAAEFQPLDGASDEATSINATVFEQVLAALSTRFSSSTARERTPQ